MSGVVAFFSDFRKCFTTMGARKQGCLEVRLGYTLRERLNFFSSLISRLFSPVPPRTPSCEGFGANVIYDARHKSRHQAIRARRYTWRGHWRGRRSRDLRPDAPAHLTKTKKCICVAKYVGLHTMWRSERLASLLVPPQHDYKTRRADEIPYVAFRAALEVVGVQNLSQLTAPNGSNEYNVDTQLNGDERKQRLVKLIILPDQNPYIILPDQNLYKWSIKKIYEDRVVAQQEGVTMQEVTVFSPAIAVAVKEEQKRRVYKKLVKTALTSPRNLHDNDGRADYIPSKIAQPKPPEPPEPAILNGDTVLEWLQRKFSNEIPETIGKKFDIESLKDERNQNWKDWLVQLLADE